MRLKQFDENKYEMKTINEKKKTKKEKNKFMNSSWTHRKQCLDRQRKDLTKQQFVWMVAPPNILYLSFDLEHFSD